MATANPRSTENLESNKRERVYNLTIELLDIKTQKKAAMGGFNDEIKRLNAEIKEICEDTPAEGVQPTPTA